MIIVQHRYDDIAAWYQRLARDYSGLVKYVESIGTSVEGRNIPAVHIYKDVSAVPNYTVFSNARSMQVRRSKKILHFQ